MRKNVTRILDDNDTVTIIGTGEIEDYCENNTGNLVTIKLHP